MLSRGASSMCLSLRVTKKEETRQAGLFCLPLLHDWEWVRPATSCFHHAVSVMMDSTFNLQTKTTFCSVRSCQVCCYSNKQFNQYNTQIEIKSDESTPKGHEQVARGNWHFQQTWKVYLFAKRSDVQIDTYIKSRFFSPPNEVSLIVVYWYNFIWNQLGHICWVLECSYPFSK